MILSQLHQRIIDCIPRDLTGPLGVAVSGGSDSLGLLLVLKHWREAGGPDLAVVTVDHGLRREAADEAAHVAELCRQWGIPHSTLRWQDRPVTGNLSDQARRARYGLMADWAISQGVGAVAVAHTRDDQAETVLMRLSRSSGVDGLAAMRQDWAQGGARFLRPALTTQRAELRRLLQDAGVSWIDDPTNTDPSYDRPRIRAAWPALAEIGLTPETLCQVARHMAVARDSLEAAMWQAARKIAQIQQGDVLVDRPGLAQLDPECARRLLQAAMRWISGAAYPPRGPAQLRLLETVLDGGSMTLQGCHFVTSGPVLRITREAKALYHVRVPFGQIWDGRWQFIGPQVDGAYIAALGAAGLPLCPDRADSGLPAVSLCASPALWQDGDLLSAPLAGLENGWVLKPVPRHPHDFAVQITH